MFLKRPNWTRILRYEQDCQQEKSFMNEPDKSNDIDLIETSKQAPAELKNDTPDYIDKKYSDTKFFPVSEGKLITLYILSFGLYGIYWFYGNWKLQQTSMDKKIYPVWRAIFSIFFVHSLFKCINQQASHLEHKHKFNANALATFFVITIVASNILDHLYGNIQMPGNMSNNSIIITSLVLFILSIFPLLKVQATVNRINNDMLGYLNYKYSLANYVLILAGSFMWFLIALGLLFDFMGIVTIE